MDERNLVIYGLVPTDLESLREPNGVGSRGGKVGAHGLHAGNQILKYADTQLVKDYIADGIAQGADTFNTCITLDVTSTEIEYIVECARQLGYIGDVVIDPTYPWFVDMEVAPFLNNDCTLVPSVIKDNKMLVTRSAVTFGWILGDVNDPIFKNMVSQLNLAK